MKKISTLVLLTAILISSANAQTVADKKCNWGLKLGLNGSNIRIKNGENSDWKTGLVAGVFVKIKVSERFSIQPEALYSSMGGRNVNGGEDASLRLNYFSLPVLAQYHVTKTFSVFAGPQVDVMIQAKSKMNNDFETQTDFFKENSFNATAGVAAWPSHCFGFSARYIYGLNNIAARGGMEMTNQGVQLAVALKLGKK